MRRDFWINESVHKLIVRHLEIIRDNIKLRKELEKKQKLIRYYRKEKRKLKEKLDKLQDEYDELYIEKCNASNQWKCCEAENKELKDKLLTYMRK